MKLEETIRQRRDELDIELPSPAVWKGVQRQLQPPVKMRTGYGWWAAAAILLLSAGFGWILTTQDKNADALAGLPRFSPSAATNLQPGNLHKDDVLTTQTAAAPLLVKQPSPRQASSPLPARQRSGPGTRLPALAAGNFYSEAINMIRTKINETPVKWVDKDFFSIYLNQYKDLEKEEETWKKQWATRNSDEDFMRNLISINKRKLNVLETLYKQMQNINSKRGDTALQQTNRIII